MLYVADTHSLLWFLAEDSRLSEKAKEVFEKAEKDEAIIIIPTIVLVESLYIIEKKRAKSKFTDILEKIKIAKNFASIPLDLKIVEKIQNLTKLKEAHDKIIVASARLLDAKLITKDSEIIESNYVETVW